MVGFCHGGNVPASHGDDDDGGDVDDAFQCGTIRGLLGRGQKGNGDRS